jgi:hypothetical protein
VSDKPTNYAGGCAALYFNGEWRLRTTPEGYEIKCPVCGQTNTQDDHVCKACDTILITNLLNEEH